MWLPHFLESGSAPIYPSVIKVVLGGYALYGNARTGYIEEPVSDKLPYLACKGGSGDAVLFLRLAIGELNLSIVGRYPLPCLLLPPLSAHEKDQCSESPSG